jgi:hypothetical protein
VYRATAEKAGERYSRERQVRRKKSDKRQRNITEFTSLFLKIL